MEVDCARMAIQTEIEENLGKALNPSTLIVENESHLHAGHAGSPGTGESHFRVHVVSDAFSGKTRLERHRLVNEILADLLKGRIHALAIHAKAPGED